jgi:hypothetical protein
MASERLNFPPVPSVARTTQPANEDAALFILQSVLKTGAHLPSVKWHSLVKLLWDPPQTQVPSTVSTGSGRPLGAPGTSDRLLMRSSTIMGSLTTSRTPILPPSRPWPGASAVRRRLQLLILRTGSVVMPTLVACRRALLKTTIRRARLACSQKGQASTHHMCVARLPCVSKSSRMRARSGPESEVHQLALPSCGCGAGWSSFSPPLRITGLC